jgi:hypothetical protein
MSRGAMSRGATIRIASTGLLVLLASTSAAHAGGRHENWKAVERLAQDKPLLVQVRGQAGADACRIVSADDTTLTCVRERDPNVDWDAGSGARLVFPRTAVRNLWLMEEDDGLGHLWIHMGIGFAIGALVCSGMGPGPAFICAGIGALIAGSAVGVPRDAAATEGASVEAAADLPGAPARCRYAVDC